MDPTVTAILGVLMRWMHVASAVVLLGGIFYAWTERTALAVSFRPVVYFCIAVSLVSGFYNFLTKGTFPKGYHMWFGIKVLLVLHIWAVAYLLTRPGSESKSTRRMTGIIVSGSLVLLISAWLRWITLHPPVV